MVRDPWVFQLGCGGVSWDVSWSFLCCSSHLAFTGKCQQVCRRKTDVESKLADLLGLKEA